MSSKEETVSAYEAYKTAKDTASSRKGKRAKKSQKGSKSGKVSSKNTLKKLTRAADSQNTGKWKGLSSSGSGSEIASGSKNKKKRNLKHNRVRDEKKTQLKDFNGINQVAKSDTSDSKKLDTADQEKDINLENDLELQKSDESFLIEGSEKEQIYSNSDNFSDEFNGFSNDASDGEEESVNPNDETSKTVLEEPMDGPVTKKRKLPAGHDAKQNKAIEKSRRRSVLANNCYERAEPSKLSTTSKLKLAPFSPPSDIVKLNSIEEGKRTFKWLLNPVNVDDFFSNYWEQKACLIKRRTNIYFGHLISFESIDQMLLRNHVEFTKNIDVTSYQNGVRKTLNPEGRALPPVVWDHYGQGCSIRLLNPQTFIPSVFTLCTTLQEYFHCLVGANAYLTPPNSQGFAPHYDDIEAFVLQIEGRKRWKLYKPLDTTEILPRYSSRNFNEEEIGEPVLVEVLEPGDVLYFPRGTIHQAFTEPGYHSLHITLSVYQKQSYADLFEKMLPLMLKKAIDANVELRKGLPLHVWQHAGIAYSDVCTQEREDFTKKVTKSMHKLIRDVAIEEIVDASIDQLAKKFQHEALPPEILPAERLRTVFGSHNRTNASGECVCDYDIDQRTNVRLLRANILRLVEEEQKWRIYYYLDNSKEYCEYEPNFMEIEPLEAASIEVLIKSYPLYVGVSELPIALDEDKINLVTALWERGLLMMEKPFL